MFTIPFSLRLPQFPPRPCGARVTHTGVGVRIEAVPCVDGRSFPTAPTNVSVTLRLRFTTCRYSERHRRVPRPTDKCVNSALRVPYSRDLALSICNPHP